NTIEPIPQADAIERIRVLGWWVVAKKGDYRVGDRIIYCEIDSLLPERPEFEFLRPSSFQPNLGGFRIKTVKLRGQISQGICFPLSLLPTGTPTEVGTDVTEHLGIRKWEPPISASLSGRVKGPFPGFLSKTDETRVQVLEDVLARHRRKTFALTEKLDGTSFTAFLREDDFGLCSRNLWLDESDTSNVLVRFANEMDLSGKLRSARAVLGHDLAIQGELIGPGIQKNKYRRPVVELYIFNVLNLATGKLLDFDAAPKVLNLMQLNSVPQLGTIVLGHSVDELVQMAEGVSQLASETQREGLVLRPLVEEDDAELGGRLSFKAINPKFLLKYDE
ncbi:MAG: RNA ligase (ATP), partial [Gemmataceae bacterium]